MYQFKPGYHKWGQKFLKFRRRTYTRYSLVLDKEQNKKDLGVYVGNFETFTRYLGVAGEKEILGGDLKK